MGNHAIIWPNVHRLDGSEMKPTVDDLFSEHYEKVMLAAYRVTGNLQDAEDVLQTIFLRLLKRDELSINLNSSAAYLCQAAINASLDLLRSRKRVQTELFNEEIHASEKEAPDSNIHGAELSDQLRKALLRLDQRTAEIFALRYFEEFSNAEIAALMETSSNTVAVTIHRARAQLQDILGKPDQLGESVTPGDSKE